MTDLIQFTTNENNIAILRLNRPKVRNALNWAAQEAFATAVTQAQQNPNLRALIITGTGDQAFAAGGDLKQLQHHLTSDDGARLNRIMSRALHQLTQLPIPVIAAINGDAFGGGCEILTACDLRLARDNATFYFAQIRNAVTTGWGGAARLVPLVGASRAMELLLTGRPLNAHEAQQIGFIHRLIPAAGDPLDAALGWAAELNQLPRHTLAALKQLVHAASHQPVAATYQLESQLFVDLWTSPDHLEAVAAFAQKRPPQFNQ
ncbi:MAG TPA: enoyl-CoA hydratase/isomerase family protein [Anaerolineae bacterium]|nr:enoyl-CoA hydratase/isomerase family protein [Anaerolineae bacterium]